MHQPDFIHAMEGKPWRDRACSFDAADCWGLVVLYYRHVLGIEIHQTPDYGSWQRLPDVFFRRCRVLASGRESGRR